MKQIRTLRESVHMIGLYRRAMGAVLLFAVSDIFNKYQKHRPVVIKKRICLSGENQNFPITLYTRKTQKVRPVFIVFAGNRAYTRKYERLLRATRVLATVGYHVIVVDDSKYTGIGLDPSGENNIIEFIDAVRRNGLFDPDRIILAASDFSSRFLFALLNNLESSRKVAGYVFLSPVAEIKALVKFAFTGRTKTGKYWNYTEPDAITRLLYLYNVIYSGKNIDTPDSASNVVRKFLEDRQSEALKNINNLEPDVRKMIFSVYRGDMDEESIRDFLNIDISKLEKQFISSLPDIYFDRPVFVIQSIFDTEIDRSQGYKLIRSIKSICGAYLHETDLIMPKGVRGFVDNPARWIRGVYRMTNALYKIFAMLYCTKNYPYNPTGKAIRIID